MSMTLPEKLKGFSLFVDGKGYAGRVTEITLPKLTRKMAEFRAGGMDRPIDIDMGGEKLETSYTLAEYSPEVIKLWGLMSATGVKVTVRGSVKSDDDESEEKPVELVITGRHKEMDMGSWKAGDEATMKVALSITYCKYVYDGETLFEIDIANMVEKVGDQDRLASRRKNLGVA